MWVAGVVLKRPCWRLPAPSHRTGSGQQVNSKRSVRGLLLGCYCYLLPTTVSIHRRPTGNSFIERRWLPVFHRCTTALSGLYIE